MTLFVLYDFQRVGEVLEDYAFFLCLFDFYHVGRHLVFCSSVNVINFLCAKSYSGSASVHCGVSAADDSNLFAHADFFVSYNFSKEIDTADYALCVFALAADTGGNPCADTQENRIEVSLDCFKRNVLANLCIRDNFNTHHFDGCDFFVKNSLRESVFRNTVSEHTACLRHCFEDGYSVTHLS